jgi:hypothetical protein
MLATVGVGEEIGVCCKNAKMDTPGPNTERTLTKSELLCCACARQ